MSMSDSETLHERNMITSTNKKTDWFCPKTGIYSSLHPTMQLPTQSDIDVVTFMFSQKHAGETALVDSATGYSISYTELLPLVKSIALGLIENGVKKGDVVLLLLPNSVLFPILFLSVLYAGGVVTAMSPLSTDFEIKKQVTHASVKAGFTDLKHIDLLKKMGVSAIQVPDTFSSSNDMLDFCQLLKVKKTHVASIVRPVVYQDDTAAILYSSGTTGASKGVLLSHRNLIAAAVLFVRFDAFQYDDLPSRNVNLAALPMFHVYGLSLFVIGLLSLGSTIVVMSKFEIKEAMRVIDRYKITHFHVVPPIMAALTAKAKDGYASKFRSLKQVSVGASNTHKQVVNDFCHALPWIDFIQGYGMTESSAVGTRGFNSGNLRKHFSVGLLAPNMQAKVVNWTTGTSLPPGLTGELWLRGPGIMKGYLNDPVATKEAVDKDGWMRTGDIVFFDSDGYLYIVDRLKEMIKYKGFQIAPGDLEAALISHPEIVDVAVTGAKDEVAGEIPVAFIVRAPGSSLSQKAVFEYMSEKVAPHKKVRRIIFTDSIPRSPAGKILRRALKHALISKL